MFYFVTGKLGSGKTLCSVGRIRDYLRRGSPVATNLNLDLVAMFGAAEPTKHIRVIRVPDKPTAEDLYNLGRGNESYDESLNGLLVLDECGTWFNARNWSDKSRAALNDWFLHARKLGWDVILIIQNLEMVDKQAKLALAEFTVHCKKSGNFSIPVISSITKLLLDFSVRLPKGHIARVVYGEKFTDPMLERWVYRGTDLYKAYDTKQAFLANYEDGLYSLVPPWQLKGRYQCPRDMRFYKRMARIILKKYHWAALLLGGALFGVTVSGTVLAYVVTTQIDRIAQDRDNQIAAISSQIETMQAAPVLESDVVRDPLEQFQGFHVASIVQVGGRQEIVFQNKNGQRLYSTDYRFFVYKRNGFCDITIINGSDSLPLSCSGLDLASPRRDDAKRPAGTI